MSCIKCQESQREMGTDKNGNATTDLEQVVGTIQPVPIHYTFVRVGNGNVLISGCREHLKQLLDFYRVGRASSNE